MNVSSDVRVTIRVDRELKERAECLFEKLGMNMTTALNVFLRKSVDEEAIPFPVSVKSSAFMTGYTSDDITNVFAATVKNDIAERRQNGLPVARYDDAKKAAYLERADGTREYVGK